MADDESINISLLMAYMSAYYYVISMSVTLLLDKRKKHLSRPFDDLGNKTTTQT